MSFLVELPLHEYRADAFDRFDGRIDFDLGTARAMMWLSQLSYEVRGASGKLEPVLRRWNLDLVSRLTHRRAGVVPLASTRGLIAHGRGATFIAFAGTDPFAIGNWVTNFSLGARAREVHRGFEIAVDAVWDRIAAALRAAPAWRIYFTGHSLGGALAIVAAEKAARELGIVATGIYAFGAPRPGAANFAAAYNACGLGERTFRLVHGHDIIPTMPPAAFGFRHVGRMLNCARAERFGSDGLSAPGCNDPPFIATLKKGYRQRLRDILSVRFPAPARPGFLGHYHRIVLPPPLGDHLPDRYRKALDR